MIGVNNLFLKVISLEQRWLGVYCKYEMQNNAYQSMPVYKNTTPKWRLRPKAAAATLELCCGILASTDMHYFAFYICR